MNPVTERRLVRVAVADEVFSHLFVTGAGTGVRITRGLPPTAVLVNIHRHPLTGTVELLYADAAFPPVEPGCVVPEYRITFERRPAGYRGVPHPGGQGAAA